LPLLAVSWLLPIERSFADLSLDDLSPDDLSFDDRVFADPLFNDLPFDAVAVAPRAEKKVADSATRFAWVDDAAARRWPSSSRGLASLPSLPLAKCAFCISEVTPQREPFPVAGAKIVS